MNNSDTNSITNDEQFQTGDGFLSCGNDDAEYTPTDEEMAEMRNAFSDGEGVAIDNPANVTENTNSEPETPSNETCAGDTKTATDNPKNSDEKNHAQIAEIITEARNQLDDLPESDCRSLPKDFLRRHEIGYASNWRHPKAPKSLPTPRFIFRLGDANDPPSFNAVLTPKGRFDLRNASEDVWEAQKCLSAGKKLIFNPAALDTEIVPVTEGEFDSLSITFATDERIQACALGGAGIFPDLIRRLKAMERRPRIVALFDKDTAGQQHATDLLKKLSEIGVVAVVKFFDDFMTDEQKQLVGNKIDANAILQKCGKQVLSDLTDQIIASARADFPNVEDKIREQKAFRKIEQRRGEQSRPENFSDEIQALIDNICENVTNTELEQKGYLKHSERGAKAPDGYCCPFCGSGEGDHKTGAMKYITKDGTPHFGCGKCGRGGNAIAFLAHVKNLSTTGKEFFNTLKDIADEFNINYNPKIFEPSRRFKRGSFSGIDEEIIAQIRENCDWRCFTWKDDDGKTKFKRVSIKPTQANLDLIFENDPNLRGLVGKDQFQGVIVFLKKAIWHNDDRTGEQWNGGDDAQLRVYLRKNYADLDGKQRIEDTLIYFAHRNAFHTVKKFLSNLPKWDGVPRAENLFVKFLHAEDSEFTRAVTMNFLFGALARVYHPGCDFQTCVVLNGAQRIGKSKLVKMLGGKEGVNPDGKNWHVALKDSVDDTHAIDALLKGWVIEIEEFSAARKAEINALKSFISANDDTRRFAYDRYASTRLRHNVFVVTCNDKAFLRDQTGNARFIVVECSQKKFDRVAGMTPEYIRQVWAEALVKYHELFKDRFDDAKLQLPLDIQIQAETIAEKFTQDDGLKTEIQGYLNRKILPQVIWKLLTREQRRKFIADGKITVGESELITARLAIGGRQSDVEKDRGEIEAFLSGSNYKYVVREEIKDKNGNRVRVQYILFGSEYRRHICAAEIFNECFGNDKRKSMMRIQEVLSQLDGWTSSERPIRDDPHYVNQRKPYYRDNLPVDDEPTTEDAKTDETQLETPPPNDFDYEQIDKLEEPPF